MFRITVAALCACISTSAHAQCGPADAFAKGLADKYGESVLLRGVERRGFVVEVWLNVETGTFTVVYFSEETDQRCMAAEGGEARPVAPEPAGLRL